MFLKRTLLEDTKKGNTGGKLIINDRRGGGVGPHQEGTALAKVPLIWQERMGNGVLSEPLHFQPRKWS